MLIYEYFRLVEGYVWVVDFFSLCLILYLTHKTRIISSVLISLGITVFIGGVSHHYGILILPTDPNTTKTALQLWFAEHKPELLFSWYVGFALLDCVALALIGALHRSAKVKINSITSMLLCIWFIDGLLNIGRYLDKHWTQTNYLADIYKYGIPSINVSSALVCLCFSMAVAAQYRWVRQDKQKDWRDYYWKYILFVFYTCCGVADLDLLPRRYAR